MIEHINFAKEMQVPNPIQVENGDIVKLYPGKKPELFDKAPSGKLFLDGNISVDEESFSIRERKNISANGILEITILVTPKGNLHNSPIVSYKGLPVLEKDDFLNDIENLVEKVSSTFSLINPKQKDNLIESVKIASRKLVKEKTGKKPITNINIVRI
tara:strand:- start:1275 stop:1748 length:474 start_codon:yes stop_codon:yes gene_type:complete